MTYTGPQYPTEAQIWTALGNDGQIMSDDEFARVQRYARQASRAFDSECGRSFMRIADVTRRYTAVCLPDLQIPDAASITTVTVNGTAVAESDGLTDGYLKLPLDSTEAAPLTTALRLMANGLPCNWDQHPAVLVGGPTKAITVVFVAGPDEPPPEAIEISEAIAVNLYQAFKGHHGTEDGSGVYTQTVPAGNKLVAPYASMIPESMKRPVGTRGPLAWELT